MNDNSTTEKLDEQNMMKQVKIGQNVLEQNRRQLADRIEKTLRYSENETLKETENRGMKELKIQRMTDCKSA